MNRRTFVARATQAIAGTMLGMELLSRRPEVAWDEDVVDRPHFAIQEAARSFKLQVSKDGGPWEDWLGRLSEHESDGMWHWKFVANDTLGHGDELRIVTKVEERT